MCHLGGGIPCPVRRPGDAVTDAVYPPRTRSRSHLRGWLSMREEMSFLWNAGGQSEWVLVRLSTGDYLIRHSTSRQVMIIEDHEAYSIT